MNLRRCLSHSARACAFFLASAALEPFEALVFAPDDFLAAADPEGGFLLFAELLFELFAAKFHHLNLYSFSFYS